MGLWWKFMPYSIQAIILCCGCLRCKRFDNLNCPIEIDSQGQTRWQNPRPSSTRFCRPLKVKVLNEIKQLKRSIIVSGDNVIEISHEMILSMKDGKVWNALTETTSTQRCYICNYTSKDFNNIEVMIEAPTKTGNLKYWLSILQGWISFSRAFFTSPSGGRKDYGWQKGFHSKRI